MRSLLLMVLVSLGLVSAGCGGDPDSPVRIVQGDDRGFHGALLDEPYVVPDTPLSDTAGDPYILSDGADHHLRLIFFGYTHCPDVCQVVMSTIATAVVKLAPEDQKRVQVVFVTTDPDRDTASALRTYLDHFNPDFEGLTGTVDQIAAAGVPLKVFVKQGDRLPGGGYDVSHSTQVMAAEGDRVHLLWTQGTSPAQMAGDITKLLKG